MAQVDSALAKEKNIQTGYVFVRPNGQQLEQIADIEQRPVAAIMRAVLEQGVEEVLDSLLYDDKVEG